MIDVGTEGIYLAIVCWDVFMKHGAGIKKIRIESGCYSALKKTFDPPLNVNPNFIEKPQ